jgi:hypothetical protein
MQWIDRYSGRTFRVTTRGHHGGAGIARVQTYGEVIESYEYHPEAKFADGQGEPCRKQTVGLLQRRHVRIDLITLIGKESNSLEEVQAGLVHDEENIYTTYDDPSRDYWQTTVLPVVRQAPLAMLVKACAGELSRRAIIEIRPGRSTPHQKNQALLGSLARKLGLL